MATKPYMMSFTPAVENVIIYEQLCGSSQRHSEHRHKTNGRCGRIFLNKVARQPQLASKYRKNTSI